jgi:hypothetical protein
VDDSIDTMHQLADERGISDAGDVGCVLPWNGIEANDLVLGNQLLGNFTSKLA